MASVYDLKPAFQRLLRPLVDGLARAGVSPNAITVAALVLSAVQGAVILAWPERSWPLLLVPVTLLVRMALNAMDGLLAREHGLASRLGMFLNELGDVAADALLYLPFAAVVALPGEGTAPAAPELLVALVTAAGLTEMAGVVAVQAGGSRRYDGPLGKSDRAVLFGGLALALGLGAPTGVWLTVVLALALLLTLLTVALRVGRSLSETEAGTEAGTDP